MDFIFVDKIDEGVCRNLINIFESNEKFHFSGQVYGGQDTDDYVDLHQKNSTDFKCLFP